MRTVVVVCAIAASAFIAPSAWADLFNPLDLDQSQESQNYAYGVGGTTTWMAQSFTAGRTGTLYGVEIGNTTGGVVWGDVSLPVVEIFAGEPGSAGFGSVTSGPVYLDDPVPSDGWLGVPFNFSVTAGYMYSIVVRPSDAGSVTVGATTSDSYTRGALWTYDALTRTWFQLPALPDIPVYDMQFHTHVLVPLPAGVWLGILGLSVAGWRLKRQTA